MAVDCERVAVSVSDKVVVVCLKVIMRSEFWFFKVGKLYGFSSHSLRLRSFFAASGFSFSNSSMAAALINLVEIGGSILQSLA